MAKKALIEKQQAKPKFKVRGYTRCRRCGRPRAVYRKFGLCRICLRELVHAGEVPGVTKAMVAPSVPPEVHTEGVVVVKLTVSPDEAPAPTVTGDWARVASANPPKSIIWGARETLKLWLTGGARL